MSIFGGLPLSSTLIPKSVMKSSPLKRPADAIAGAKKVVGGTANSIGKIAVDSAVKEKSVALFGKTSQKMGKSSGIPQLQEIPNFNIPLLSETMDAPGERMEPMPIGTGLSPLGPSGIPDILPISDEEEAYTIGDVEVVGSRAGAPKTDRRVRLKSLTGREEDIYGPDEPDNPMAILHETGGLLFPYTPTISFSQDVDYRSSDLTHSNMDILSFNRSPSVTLNISGKFTVQNQREGRYLVAVTHFLRTVSKMYFGREDADAGVAGIPPPVLMFDGYGNYMFNNLRCVVKSHSYTLDESADYVDIYMNEGDRVTRLPSVFTLNLVLTVTRTPNALKNTFSLEKFRSGELMNNKGGWI